MEVKIDAVGVVESPQPHMPNMNTLLIEDGILLKSYVLPWKPDGWGPPPRGWTPADDAWIKERADQLMQGWRDVLEQEPPPDTAYKQARQERGEILLKAHRPWPGWLPITPQRDPKISRAYWNLFKALNPELKFPMPRQVLERKKARWPADGYYVMRKGKMVHEEVG